LAAGRPPATLPVELTVVDSVGRLQIPKDLREQFSIQDRVRLEAVEGGVFIRPVRAEQKESVEEMVDRLEQGGRAHALQQFAHWARAVWRSARAPFGLQAQGEKHRDWRRLWPRGRGDQKQDD
jgi:AbrB family looped-hinge helix DNA binding protein